MQCTGNRVDIDRNLSHTFPSYLDNAIDIPFFIFFSASENLINKF